MMKFLLSQSLNILSIATDRVPSLSILDKCHNDCMDFPERKECLLLLPVVRPVVNTSFQLKCLIVGGIKQRIMEYDPALALSVFLGLSFMHSNHRLSIKLIPQVINLCYLFMMRICYFPIYLLIRCSILSYREVSKGF